MSWKQIDGFLQLLDIGSESELWGIDDCQVFKWNIKSWLHAKGVLASSLAVGADNSIWCTTKDHKIYRLVGGIDGKWMRVDGFLKQIAVGDENNIWGINSKDEVFYRRGNVWIQAPGNLSQVSVAADGTCWGVNANHEIFRWNGEGWDSINGNLIQIKVASIRHVIGINHKHEVFLWKNGDWKMIEGGLLKHVSISPEGNVWGINEKDEIWCLMNNVDDDEIYFNV
ncbi:15172_t:CDS:2 [Funneliformis mosseae]|uniref:15172_t:CDS:1 n=1 Tax=Funneliformis mosseae TaxID=27381 RepID=A0A9N9CGN1_FUNMO|nr:15172_t:CDS:2 [Funneliformis mosseae]